MLQYKCVTAYVLTIRADCKRSHVPAKMRFVAHVARPQTKINHSTEYDDLMMRMRGTGDARARQSPLVLQAPSWYRDRKCGDVYHCCRFLKSDLCLGLVFVLMFKQVEFPAPLKLWNHICSCLLLIYINKYGNEINTCLNE